MATSDRDDLRSINVGVTAQQENLNCRPFLFFPPSIGSIALLLGTPITDVMPYPIISMIL